ncbi:MAG: ATPase [Proteobacteria bacterium]|nr:ATPase [Pseudomonadota bacterium]
MKGKDVTRRPARRDRLIDERVHDPYKTRLKLPEPTICPGCGAVFHEGRWQWAAKPKGAHEALCQACHRIRDECPAGQVTLSGAFVKQHREELIHLARHQEQEEKGDHPLHRIMGIEEGEDGLVIATTDIHLPRRIGEAIHRAFRGELEFHYAEEEYFLRVSWRREA